MSIIPGKMLLILWIADILPGENIVGATASDFFESVAANWRSCLIESLWKMIERSSWLCGNLDSK